MGASGLSPTSVATQSAASCERQGSDQGRECRESRRFAARDSVSSAASTGRYGNLEMWVLVAEQCIFSRVE